MVFKKPVSPTKGDKITYKGGNFQVLGHPIIENLS